MGFPGGASGKEPTCQCRRHKRRFLKKNFNWRTVTSHYSGGPCHLSTRLSHGSTCTPSPIPNTPSYFPLHRIPLGCPRAPALSVQLHASNLRCSSVLHMVEYMFQCCSLISAHPCLLPHSPVIVCSLHLCLFCCLAYRILVTIFLNSIYIYVLLYRIGVSLSDLLHSV